MTMPDNRISPELPFAASDVPGQSSAPRPSLAVRATARLRAHQLDRQVAVGVPAPAGSPLAVHQTRLTSPAEREAVARALRLAVHDAHAGHPPFSSRIPVHSDNVAAAEDLIDTITLRLHSPRPVSARGMARLRLVLCDGCGPMYFSGRGDLSGRLGAALAEL
jgi:hypothetical protein